MRQHDIAPTPRNYEVWLAFCGNDKPPLTERLNAMLKSGHPLSPGVLADLHREFFTVPYSAAVVDGGARELQGLSGAMLDHVTLDREMLIGFGKTLAGTVAEMDATASAERVRRASATAADATMRAGQQLRDLGEMLAVSMVSVADLRDRLNQAETDSNTDKLTGLPNRRQFDAAIQAAIARASEDASALSLLLLDIDHFKRFNDTYGHNLGDLVLALVSAGLMEILKDRTVARYGGEEFAILLPGIEPAAALRVAELVRQTMEKRPVINRANSQSYGVLTCSIGVSYYRQGEMAGDFIDRADQALYAAKKAGRNAVRSEAAAVVALPPPP
jgi:diguanylate cyclase